MNAKKKKRKGSITISLGADDQLYVDLDWLRNNPNADQNMEFLITRLLSGQLNSTIMECLSTIDNPVVINSLKLLQSQRSFLNPLDVI